MLVESKATVDTHIWSFVLQIKVDNKLHASLIEHLILHGAPIHLINPGAQFDELVPLLQDIINRRDSPPLRALLSAPDCYGNSFMKTFVDIIVSYAISTPTQLGLAKPDA